MTVLTRVDAKGKVYTNRIGKEQVRVLVQTTLQTLIGTAYLRPGNRLLDELNDARTVFLALTEVRVYDREAQTVLFTTDFLALNKAAILSIVPVEDLPRDGGGVGVWLSALQAALREETGGIL